MNERSSYAVQTTFLADPASHVPTTEGVKYAGSKLKLVPQILLLAQKVNPTTVLDGFSGTTRVSQAFVQYGCRVIANDIAIWSSVFGTCYLLHNHPVAHYEDLIRHLNSVPEKDGWFTEHYGGDANGMESGLGGVKKPWQRHNTRKLDAIRDEIERLSLSDCEKAVALTSLILALDKVDSTLGHYASYLREWSPRSYNRLKLKVPRLMPREMSHEVHRADILELLPSIETDLAYFDPPYGSNNEKMPPSRIRYGAYYHVWTTVCLNDKPELFGRVNRRKDTSDDVSPSVFEDFRKNDQGEFVSVRAIRELLDQTRAKHIILSYSSGGRATAQQLNTAISDVGKIVEVVELNHQRNVMASMRWTNEWVRHSEEQNREFLFLIQK